MSYTVNISGNHADKIKAVRLEHAYDCAKFPNSEPVTAIETGKQTAKEARELAWTIITLLDLDSRVLYAFE